MAAYPGLLLKDSYWRWPQRNLCGNTIDLFVKVLGLSFHQAIGQIIVSVTPGLSITHKFGCQLEAQVDIIEF